MGLGRPEPRQNTTGWLGRVIRGLGETLARRVTSGLAGMSLGVLAGLAYGVCMLVALPPTWWWPMAFVAPMPLAMVALMPGGSWGGSVRSRAIGAGVGSLPYWWAICGWVGDITAAGLPGLLLIQMSYPALFVGLVGWLAGRVGGRGSLVGVSARGWMPLVAGVVWAGLEFFRSEVFFTGFAWGVVAHPLIESPGLASGAAWLGVPWLCLWMVVMAAERADVWGSMEARGVGAGACGRRCWSRWRWTGLSVVMLGLPGVVSPVPPTEVAGPRIAVGLVQTNVPQSVKGEWTRVRQVAEMEALVGLSSLAAAGRSEGGRAPGVVLWPETMVPFPGIEPEFMRQLFEGRVVFPLEEPLEPGGPTEMWATYFADKVGRHSEGVEASLLVGTTGITRPRVIKEGERFRFEHEAVHNSVYLVHEGRVARTLGGSVARYDKGVLTPFGEVMPGISRIEWLERALLAVGASGMSFDLSPGRGEPVIFDLELATSASGPRTRVRAATPICFEVAYAGVTRDLVFGGGGGRRADVLLSPSNDGWFKDSDRAREMFWLLARWRCVELATPMGRAANTGISGVIDAWGRELTAGVPTEGSGTGERRRSRSAGVIVAEVPLATRDTLAGRVGNAWGWIMLGAMAGLVVLGLVRGR